MKQTLFIIVIFFIALFVFLKVLNFQEKEMPSLSYNSHKANQDTLLSGHLLRSVGGMTKVIGKPRELNFSILKKDSFSKEANDSFIDITDCDNSYPGDTCEVKKVFEYDNVIRVDKIYNLGSDVLSIRDPSQKIYLKVPKTNKPFCVNETRHTYTPEYSSHKVTGNCELNSE